jgi:DNA-binding LacI/PurR family transcriptional regulator
VLFVDWDGIGQRIKRQYWWLETLHDRLRKQSGVQLGYIGPVFARRDLTLRGNSLFWHKQVMGAVAADSILKYDQGTQAIICLDDEVAHGVWERLKYHNRDDIKVIGYDNTAVARYSDITSVNLKRGARARWAFEQILTVGGKYPRTEWIDTKCEPRGSCCPELRK